VETVIQIGNGLDSRLKNCGNDKQKNICFTLMQSIEEFFCLKIKYKVYFIWRIEDK